MTTFDPSHLVIEEDVVEVRERATPVQPEGAIDQRLARARLRGQDVARPIDELVEHVDVDPVGRELQAVAGCCRRDDCSAGWPEDAAQLEDLIGDGLGAGCGKLVAPHVVEQAVGGHGLPGVEDEAGEHGPLARRGQRPLDAVDLEPHRSQHADPHAGTAVRGPRVIDGAGTIHRPTVAGARWSPTGYRDAPGVS